MASGAFAGLLFNPTSSIIMSKTDSTYSQDDARLLASPRLIEVVDIIVPSLYHDTFFYLGTGTMLSFINDVYVYAPILSFLAGGGIRLYLKEALDSIIELRAIFSSGDADSTSTFREGNTEGNATAFIPISRPNLALVFSPQLGNIFLAELRYSLKPFSWAKARVLGRLQTELKGVVFFRPTSGLISEPGINPDSDSIYLGTEVDWIINFKPFSDLGLALSLGLFMPDNGTAASAFLADERKIEFLGRFELSFSF